MINKLKGFALVLGVAVFTACSGVSDLETVEVDEKFSKLFIRKGGGFTGGDGTYSVLLPDGRSVWIFGDTFLGTVNEDGTRKRLDPMYIRNSFVIQDGDSLTTFHVKDGDVDRSTIIPPQVVNSNYEVSELMEWYWPGDGFVENDQLKVFVSEFHQPDTGMWGFEWKGLALASFNLPDLTFDTIVVYDFPNEQEIHFGHAVVQDDKYTYVYGLGKGKPHVARALLGNVEQGWEFYSKEGWDSLAINADPIIDVDGSEQFSVFKHQNKYVFITQLGGFSTDIVSFTSDNPILGWENKQLLYSTPMPVGEHNLITYNACAHPQFDERNALLISYNTNSFVLEDHFTNADIYRPRFVRIPYKLIHPEFK